MSASAALRLVDDGYVLQGFFQQKVDQLVSGAIGLRGKLVQLGQRILAHANGNHLMPILALFRLIRISRFIPSPHKYS